MAHINNLERLRGDLQRLIDRTGPLELAILVLAHGKAEVAKLLKVNISDDSIKAIPSFNVEYESWYSEALTVIRQLLPDRLQDFREHFEAAKNRKELNFTSYRIQDALKGVRVTRSFDSSVIADSKAAIPHFRQQAAILTAAERRFESALFEIRQLVQADLFDDEIAAARELLKNKFLRAAGAVAGVVLERHLKQVCDDHSLKIAKKNPGIGDLNEALRSSGTIDVPQWRFISMLGDIRNLCDHNKAVEPTADQVADLVEGASKVLKTVF